MPLQDHIEDLYSLLHFLRAYPYAYYFCEDCDARTLDFRFPKYPQCPSQCARYFLWWNKVITRKDSLDIGEYETYKSLFCRSREQFHRFRRGTLIENYFHMFAMMVRLRQVVDHPYFLSYSRTELASGYKEAGDVEQSCDLCQDAVEDPVVTSCSIMFCEACLIDFVDSIGRMACPSCTKPLTFDKTTNNDKGDSNSKHTLKGFSSSSILHKIQRNEFETSTKIEALKEEIGVMVQKDSSAKGIVFSQFTSFLDLIQHSLDLSGINCVQLVGSMSITARAAAVNKFNEDSNCRILLMSLKAGGVAVNVTVASHVFWWNPAVEQQAQDRIYRIGQHKPVKIVRFVIEDTIEEKISKIQEHKKLLFKGTVGFSLDALGKLTEKDLISLFYRHF